MFVIPYPFLFACSALFVQQLPFQQQQHTDNAEIAKSYHCQ